MTDDEYADDGYANDGYANERPRRGRTWVAVGETCGLEVSRGSTPNGADQIISGSAPSGPDILSTFP